jgi:hypothetical protein
MRAISAPRRLDAVLAAVLAVWWLVEVGELATIGAISLVLTTAPIAWRRSAPLAAAGLVAAGFALSAADRTRPSPSRSSSRC